MKREIKEALPDWWSVNDRKFLTLSNDIDSMASMRLLEQVNSNWKFRYFLDFESGIYYSSEFDGILRRYSEMIGVDIAFDFKNIKTFDNHVSTNCENRINPNSINLNNTLGITSQNYFKKYCGSTLLMLYSLYDIPLPKSNYGKCLILCIDSTYKSYFNAIEKKKDDWLKIHRYWLCEVLELEELYWFETKYSREDFDKFSFINKAKIQVIDENWNDEYTMYFPLEYRGDIEKHLEMSLNVPEGSDKMKLGIPCVSKAGNVLKERIPENELISFAMTKKDFASYSLYKGKTK